MESQINESKINQNQNLLVQLNTRSDEIELKQQKKEGISKALISQQKSNSLQLQLQCKQQVKQSKHQTISYRADIDGLRTIAITIVVIFHAWPQFMTGGFIGVDVFFVISGFLISGIIIKQAHKKSFSFLDFYQRRIKRIYPALILILIPVFVVVCVYYMKEQLKVTCQTMAAATVFGANIQTLTFETGYFDRNVKANPLLHLWSLGVQQQFYILWPCIMLITLRYCPKKGHYPLVFYTIISFAANVGAVYSNPKWAFYFPFCRFWQMSVGGLLAYSKIHVENKKVANALSIVSVLAIFVAAFMISQDNLFPGFWALIPTLSSACIILAGKETLINKHVLSSYPFVFIGKISYPLYLWHWPLLVFSRYLYPEGSSSVLSHPLVMIQLALMLSIATYFFIEKPLRYRKSKWIVISLVGIMLIIGAISLTACLKPEAFSVQEKIQNDNLPDYLKSIIPTQDDYYIKNGRKMANSSKNRKRKSLTAAKVLVSKRDSGWPDLILDKKIDRNSKYYTEDPPKLSWFQIANQGKTNQLFLIGDSHARLVIYRLKQLYQKSKQNNDTDNFPTIVTMIKPGASCFVDDLNMTILNKIKEIKPARVLLVQRWLLYFKDCRTCFHDYSKINNQHISSIYTKIQLFANSVKQLTTLGIQVYVMTITLEGNVVNPRFMVDLNGVIQNNIKPIRLSQFRQTNKIIIQKLQDSVSSAGGHLVDFVDHLCWEDFCEVVGPAGYPVFTDSDHQTILYSQLWSTQLDFLTQFSKKS